MMYDKNKNQSVEEIEERVWKAAQAQHVCMMTTWDGKKQQARPMTPHCDRDRHAIYFLDRADSHKEAEIREYPELGLSFMNSADNLYLSLSGQATIRDDRVLIKRLWSAPYKAWWDSENDPTIRVITFTPQKAELWAGPGRLIAGAIILINAATGAQMSLGEKAEIAM